MRMSWKLGRVAGIDLFLHPTFLLVFLFAGGLPIPYVLALFGCVLLHELGHALMARRFGIETADITLYPIGGVARLKRMPRAAGAELLIALAGPAVNFAIVGCLIGLQTLGLASFDNSWLGAFASYLVLMNLVLGLFNLIPAFPMDGGRVFRALLSGWLGRVRATSVAASVGRALAMGFGLYSLLSLLVTGDASHLIHMALASFIYLAAGVEEAAVIADEQRREFGAASQDIWTAPPGYRWVHRGNGVWQLAPVVVDFRDPRRNPSSWQV
jgi:Zn-dependent protease